jgi:hypothetical protein
MVPAGETKYSTGIRCIDVDVGVVASMSLDLAS